MMRAEEALGLDTVTDDLINGIPFGLRALDVRPIIVAINRIPIARFKSLKT